MKTPSTKEGCGSLPETSSSATATATATETEEEAEIKNKKTVTRKRKGQESGGSTEHRIGCLGVTASDVLVLRVMHPVRGHIT